MHIKRYEMQVETFSYSIQNGWSVPCFPDLNSPQTMVLIFAAPEIAKDCNPLKELSQHFNQSHIIGCSSAGEINGSLIFDNTMSIAVVRFDKTELKVVKAEVLPGQDSLVTGECITNQLRSPDLRGIMVLSDGLQVNGSQLVKGLNSINDDEIVITGGLAGDGDRFGETWTIFEGEIVRNHVVAIGFY
ncbi:MAG: hypothetical protein KBB83_03500, partial [Alphaproteobacteria bacterium]|nr:hypothetical protein [Alphaproteobacteria bacterium]